MLLKDLIRKGIETVSVCYSEREAKEIVSAYMEDVFCIKRYQSSLTPDMEMSEGQACQAGRDFARIAAGEPLQYVTGKAFFYSREFRVTPDVLIPRQETEMLCHTVLSTSRRNQNILDLCTGSGCIAWTLALEMPGSKVTAVDISDGALSVASSQDFIEEMDRTHAFKPCFIKADVLKGPAVCANFFSDYATLSPKFDIIVSNPPYVMDSEKPLMRTNVLDHEPHLALFVPDDDALKFYVAVAQWAAKLLAEDGIGVVEINEALGEQTAQVFMEYGFSAVDIIQDLHGKDRFVRFFR
jgi:release factor glutamine methyltransferase